MVAYANTQQHEEFVMGNNLDQMIRRSGMTNTQVAEEKGIKRETLSRHKSGVINISRQDAEEYAQILNCLPQMIMYQASPIPCLGKIAQTKTGDWSIERDPNSHFFSDRETMPCLFLNAYFQQYTVCLQWQEEIEGVYAWMAGAYFIFSMDKARHFKVDQEAIMHNALSRDGETGKLMVGKVYPQPGSKKFTVYNGDGEFETYKDVKLDWAAPFMSALFRPDLRQAEIVEVKKDDMFGGKFCGVGQHWTKVNDFKYS